MTSPLFSLSKTAEEQISKLLVNNSNAIGLKIGLSTKGCAGLSYTMAVSYTHLTLPTTHWV